MERNLILVRGVSGSGKSTFGELLSKSVLAADDYFMRNGKYEFSAKDLPNAHTHCQRRAEEAMETGLAKVVVANTFTTEWEMEPYIEMAKRHGYKVFTVIVENRHGGTNVHGVPTKVLNKQKERFNIKL